MFFSDEHLSDAEKIDRIYRMLRAERRGRIFKLIIKLVLLGLVVYGYYYLSLPEHADVRKKIADTVQTKMTELIMPIVGNMVQDLTRNMGIPTSSEGKNTTITPEMIKAAQDAMKK